jgi:hypothetical protein
MLRGTVGSLGKAVAAGQVGRYQLIQRPWVGCSHWTTPYRPVQAFSTRTRNEGDGLFDPPELAREHTSDQSVETEKRRESETDKEAYSDMDITQDVIIIDQIDPNVLTSGESPSNPSNSKPPPTRPTLPTSIKKLNRLLSHSRDTTIPESDLIEKFVKGRGPGGQAINKTNSSVSLIHIPTGIRIQSQPTRSREENRKIARKILGERLDLIRARAGEDWVQDPIGSGTGDGTGIGTGTGRTEGAVAVNGQSRKDKERVLAKQFSRDEIRWEKERRRKSNKAKKAKKKHGTAGSGSVSDDEP